MYIRTYGYLYSDGWGCIICRVSNVVEAHGYGFTVVSGEHSRSKTSAIIAMFRPRGSSSGAKLFCT